MSDRDRFHKFTERAINALNFAQEEAQSFKDHYIGPEHLLQGLLHDEENTACTTLKELGVDIDQLRASLKAHISHEPPIFVTTTLNLTPRLKKVIELAVDEARKLNANHVGTEHLLRGIVREGFGIAAQELAQFGVTPQTFGITNAVIDSAASNPDIPTPTASSSPRIEKAPSQKAERFDKFDDPARRLLGHTQEEAQRFGQNYIGPEHLLLGLIDEPGFIANQVLSEMQVDTTKIRQSVTTAIIRGTRTTPGVIGLTPPARRVIELAVDEARRFDHRYIGTEHILLGLIREDEGIAAKVLKNLNVSLEQTRQATLKVLEGSRK